MSTNFAPDAGAVPGWTPATEKENGGIAIRLDEVERAMIEKSLRHHGGNISKAADSLGLSRAALYRRMEKYRIAT